MVLLFEKGRTQHIARSVKCREAEQLQASNSERVENCGWSSDASDNGDQANLPVASEPEVAVESTISTPEATLHNEPTAGHIHTLRFAGGERVYVERFPNPCAGAPVSNDVADPPNLHTYLSGTGNLGNPDLFETAKLLMTTGLTSSGRSQHLKSRLVSQFQFVFQSEYLQATEVQGKDALDKRQESCRRH
jgi:hypothetical protein